MVNLWLAGDALNKLHPRDAFFGLQVLAHPEQHRQMFASRGGLLFSTNTVELPS